jgi:hypothetical protein
VSDVRATPHAASGNFFKKPAPCCTGPQASRLPLIVSPCKFKQKSSQIAVVLLLALDVSICNEVLSKCASLFLAFQETAGTQHQPCASHRKFHFVHPLHPEKIFSPRCRTYHSISFYHFLRVLSQANVCS